VLKKQFKKDLKKNRIGFDKRGMDARVRAHASKGEEVVLKKD